MEKEEAHLRTATLTKQLVVRTIVVVVHLALCFLCVVAVVG